MNYKIVFTDFIWCELCVLASSIYIKHIGLYVLVVDSLRNSEFVDVQIISTCMCR